MAEKPTYAWVGWPLEKDQQEDPQAAQREGGQPPSKGGVADPGFGVDPRIRGCAGGATRSWPRGRHGASMFLKIGPRDLARRRGVGWRSGSSRRRQSSNRWPAAARVMASEYNSRPLVPEVLVKGDAFFVIRERPTYAAMLAGERTPGWLSS